MRRPRLEPESLVVGLSLVALGFLWVMSNLGRLEMLPVVRTWWPSVLVVWGLLELGNSVAARSDEARGRSETGAVES